MRPEKKHETPAGPLSRRAFLRAVALTAAATGVGALAAGCATPAETPSPAPAGPTPTPVVIEKVVEKVVTPTAGPRAKITIKMATVLPATEPINQAWEVAVTKVKERTNGDVELQIFPAGQLGGDRDTAEQSRLGANIIGATTTGYMAEFVKDFNAFSLPFLFSDWDTEGKRIFLSPLMDELADRYLRQGGMVLLTLNYFFGERHVVSTRPIETPDDMRGLKIRIPPIDMWRDLFNDAFGAAGTPLEWAEVYSALQTGVIEAAEGPFSSLRGSKLHEPAKNVSTTGHFTQVNGAHVGFKFWDTLPQDIQNIVKEEIVAAGELSAKLQLESAKTDRELMAKEGATIIDVDRVPFREKAKTVYEKYEPTLSAGLLDKIYELRGS